MDMRQNAPARQNALQQNLDAATGRLGSDHTGRDDPGVVENEQIAGAQQAGQIDEPSIRDFPGDIQMQQTAPRPLGRGMLRDQVRG
jgi:hypothetical protein